MCSSNGVTEGGVFRDGQVGESQETQFRWQLSLEPFINTVKYFAHIWWLLFLPIQVQQISFS